MNEDEILALCALHDESPQSDILDLLLFLAEQWVEFIADTHAREMARGVLIIAKGIQVCEEGSCNGQLRLTVAGKRWQELLSEAPDDPARRSAVLQIIYDAYRHGKSELEETDTQAASTASSIKNECAPSNREVASGGSDSKPKTRGNHRCLQVPAPPRDCSGVLDAVTRILTIDYYATSKQTTLTHRQVEILTKGGVADTRGILHFTNESLQRVYGPIPKDEEERKKWHARVRSGLRELRKRVTFSEGGLLTDNPNAIQHSKRVKGTPSRIQTRIEKTRWNTTIPILIERKPT